MANNYTNSNTRISYINSSTTTTGSMLSDWNIDLEISKPQNRSATTIKLNPPNMSEHEVEQLRQRLINDNEYIKLEDSTGRLILDIDAIRGSILSNNFIGEGLTVKNGSISIDEVTLSKLSSKQSKNKRFPKINKSKNWYKRLRTDKLFRKNRRLNKDRRQNKVHKFLDSLDCLNLPGGNYVLDNIYEDIENGDKLNVTFHELVKMAEKWRLNKLSFNQRFSIIKVKQWTVIRRDKTH